MSKGRKKAAPVPPQPQGTMITNCHFVGVKWDTAALETVQTVARALENLTQLFRSQGLDKPMIQIGGDSTTINGTRQ